VNNYLLDAVDKLTLKHISKVAQTNDAGISCISEVEHQPLLLQLRDAVVGGIGSKGGSSDGSARIPFDAGALALFDSIVARVNAWYLTLPDAREERSIDGRLRDWYLDFANRMRAGDVSDAEEKITLRIIEGWERAIVAMFDPPTTLELTEEHWEPVMKAKTRVRVIHGERVREPVMDELGQPVMIQKTRTQITDGKREIVPLRRLVRTEPAACPDCGERYAHDPRTGDQITAIIIEYRNIGEETLDQAIGHCRFCGQVWRGRSGMRALRWSVDHPDAQVETEVA